MGCGHGETGGNMELCGGGAGHVSWEVSAHFPGGAARVLLVHHGAQNMLNGR